MRRAARTDDNQQRVVATLRRAGVRVCVLSAFGRGLPDLMTFHRGVLRLIEVKDGAKRPSARKLTPLEERFAETWPVDVVNDEREALRVHGIGVYA